MSINVRIVTLDGEFVKLKLMHEELKKIKKQRNLIIAVFAFISMTAIILMHFYSSVIWAIAALLLIHDIMFALVFFSIMREEKEVMNEIAEIQTQMMKKMKAETEKAKEP